MTDEAILSSLKEVFKAALLEIFESHPDLFKAKVETIVIKNQRPLNSKEAAQWLSISQKTLYALHDSGVINASRVGRKLLFSLEDLTSFLKMSKGVCSTHA